LTALKHRDSIFNNINTLIKSGRGTGPMTPGNRQKCIGAKSSRKILKMREKTAWFCKLFSWWKEFFFFAG